MKLLTTLVLESVSTFFLQIQLKVAVLKTAAGEQKTAIKALKATLTKEEGYANLLAADVIIQVP
jgi:hypothetical protein